MDAAGKSIDAAFPGRGDPMPRLSQVLDRVGEAFRLPAEVLTDLRIALDEIVTNIQKYAYAGGESRGFTLHCEILNGNLRTTIEDEGVPFDPLASPEPDLTVPLASRNVGGLGVHFVKSLMNNVAYERVGNRNRVTLTQVLEATGAPHDPQ